MSTTDFPSKHPLVHWDSYLGFLIKTYGCSQLRAYDLFSNTEWCRGQGDFLGENGLGGFVCLIVSNQFMFFWVHCILFRFLWVAKNQPCLEKWLRAFFGEFLSWSQKYSWQHFWNQSRFPNEHCGSKKPQPPFQRFPPRTKTTEKKPNRQVWGAHFENSFGRNKNLRGYSEICV